MLFCAEGLCDCLRGEKKEAELILRETGTYGEYAEKLYVADNISQKNSDHSGDFRKERVSKGGTHHLESCKL